MSQINHQPIIKAAKEVIAIDSSDVQGYEQLLDFFVQKFDGSFLSVKKSCGDQKETLFLEVVSKKEKSPRKVLLYNNLNNLPRPDRGQWTKTGANPFALSQDGDFLYGLGVASSKLDFLIRLLAMNEFCKESQSGGAFLLLGGNQSPKHRRALKSYLNNNENLELGIVGEPTNLNFVYQAAGLVKVEITVPYEIEEIDYRLNHEEKEGVSSQERVFAGENKSAWRVDESEHPVFKLFSYIKNLPERTVLLSLSGGHSATTVPVNTSIEFDIDAHLKTNLMVQKLTRLRELIANTQKKLKAVVMQAQVDDEFPGLNIGTIHSYVDCVRLTGSCRLLPQVPEEAYDETFQELKNVCRGLGMAFRVHEYNRPLFQKENPLKIHSLSHSTPTISSLSCTEANFFKQKGLPALLFGPGQNENNCGSPNETVSLKSLLEAKSFYKKIIESYSL